MNKFKSIKQSVTFEATAEEVYFLFMDPNKHSAITGSDVITSFEINGKFCVFNGYCHGFNIELVKNVKIVQAWHFMEDGWPDDHFSICTFSFLQIGNKTKLNFLQTGIPEHKVASLKEGWKQYYWTPMKEYLKINVD